MGRKASFQIGNPGKKAAIRVPQPGRDRVIPAGSIEGARAMRLFMFKSEGNRGLRAFAGAPGADKLPSRFGPWTAVGVVREDKDPPHNMKRDLIEKGISEQGFQLYRMKEPKN
jgi:hypothetical protein